MKGQRRQRGDFTFNPVVELSTRPVYLITVSLSHIRDPRSVVIGHVY